LRVKAVLSVTIAAFTFKALELGDWVSINGSEMNTSDSRSNSDQTPALIDPCWILGLSECIACTGTLEFTTHFFDMIGRAVSIEQCIIFTYRPDENMHCVMAESSASPQTAKVLANDYVSGQFKKDPNFALIKGALESDKGTINTLPANDQGMPSDYLEHFFHEVHLVDKVSLTAVSEHTCYYINLYRGENIGKFTDDDMVTLNFLAPVLSALVLKNFQPQSHTTQKLPPAASTILAQLSERERQICELILQGYTLKVIATELGISETSAATYRKRAYQKLGIPSKGKLVALCRA